MNNNTLIVGTIVIGLLVIVGVFFLFRAPAVEAPDPTPTPAPILSPTPDSDLPLRDDDEDTEEEAAVREMTITSSDFEFSPNAITLTKDEPVRITFENTGIHTFTVDELGINEPITGTSAVVEFTPTVAGTFEFYCATPGHREMGQVGTLIVE